MSGSSRARDGTSPYVKIPGTLEAVFVRSIRSHAAIRGIDKQRALAAPASSRCSPLPQALDAIELVEVEYEELPAVTDPIAALEAEAPLVEPEFGSNLVLSVGITKGNSEEA